MLRSPGVGLIAVLAAIGFDDELGFDASEVSDERVNCDLPAKLEPAELAISQTVPKTMLGVGRFLPEAPRVGAGLPDCRQAPLRTGKNPHPLGYRRVDLSRKRERCRERAFPVRPKPL